MHGTIEWQAQLHPQTAMQIMRPIREVTATGDEAEFVPGPHVYFALAPSPDVAHAQAYLKDARLAFRDGVICVVGGEPMTWEAIEAERQAAGLLWTPEDAEELAAWRKQSS